ncbi:hypothetical protein UNDYM_3721 [Undibacterium sp. YM2]|uniref:phage tail tip lysozyme n=1 Tax=Undibacterium sp. YM2 TaxID=2058625 RepID=UPI001331F062|nr:phage tail tip lysozyme [Undibacterium sp. YM2]BBB67974.1 hypothetical protein UNDYM_3721 [Undibacterium sp. YM2]
MVNFQRIFGNDGLPYLIDTSGTGLNEGDDIFSNSNEFLGDSAQKLMLPTYHADRPGRNFELASDTDLPSRSGIDDTDIMYMRQSDRPRGLLSLATYDLARNSLSLKNSDVINEYDLPGNGALTSQFDLGASAYMPDSEVGFKKLKRPLLVDAGSGGDNATRYCANDEFPLFGYPAVAMSNSTDLSGYKESAVPGVMARAALPFRTKSMLEVNTDSQNDNAAGFMRFLQAELKSAGVPTDTPESHGVAPIYKYPDYGIDYNQLYAPKAAAYRKNQIIQDSHINAPIDYSNSRAAGRSRISGDADPAVQRAAINTLIEKSKQAGLNDEQTALILAIAHKESGFNPDAAAGTSSATGLGQFTNDTRKKYRLDDSNMWDMDAQADTMIKLTMDNARLAKKRLRGPEYVYKYHHDGPNKRESNDLDSKSEGMDISRSEIMPRAKTFLKILRGE